MEVAAAVLPLIRRELACEFGLEREALPRVYTCQPPTYLCYGLENANREFDSPQNKERLPQDANATHGSTLDEFKGG